jgi:plasmid maintenance system killer protein
MHLVFTARFDRSLGQAPAAVQKAFWKQVGFLLANLHHPSLRAKKYEGADEVWQARVNRDWRFYFKITGNAYSLLDITAHPK